MRAALPAPVQPMHDAAADQDTSNPGERREMHTSEREFHAAFRHKLRALLRLLFEGAHERDNIVHIRIAQIFHRFHLDLAFGNNLLELGVSLLLNLF